MLCRMPRERSHRCEQRSSAIASWARLKSGSAGGSGLGGWSGSRKRLEFFAWLEAHGFAGRNANLLSGARVAANAGFPRLHVEHAEAPEFDAFSAAERVLHGLENGFDGLFGF